MSQLNELQKIIDNGFCIGCGACLAADENIDICFDEFGMYRAEASNILQDNLTQALCICPFSNVGPNEDQLALTLFGSNTCHDARIGYYQSLYAGHVIEGEYRSRGTSGGLISWLCCRLLEDGVVDGVIHVKSANLKDEGKLFKYDISRSTQEILDGAKSRYYPVEMSKVLKFIKNTPGKYVVVGLPCFVKAVRRLMLTDSVIQERVRYCIGLVCGHLKSAAFADCFAWQMGVPPGSLEKIDFRVKLPGKDAGAYGVYIQGTNIQGTKPSRSFFGSWWGHNFFRYPACNYCDDVFSETADVTVGDAWLKNYISDSNGNSVVVVRNSDIHNLIKNGIIKGALHLTQESADAIAFSQAGGLRDRRDGLAYRLHRNSKNHIRCPQTYQIVKRVTPSLKVNSLSRRQIYWMRMKLEEKSHIFWRRAVLKMDYSIFQRNMKMYVLFDAFLPGNIQRTSMCFLSSMKKKLLEIIYKVKKVSQKTH